MGFVTTSTASGQGTLSLGGLQNVNETAAVIVTEAYLAHFLGVSPTRRAYQQAMWGLGYTLTGGPMVGTFAVTWHKFLVFEAEDIFFPAGALILADTLFWDIPQGGVMYLEADW